MESEDTGQRSTSPHTNATNVPEDSSGGSFASLVQSQDTSHISSSSKAENHPVVRQKRRRTSAEDQAILEAEYEKNSKPDKTARLEIVKRVALGEKEVQIWFQNRRQMTRRRSRPISSQDSGISDIFSSQDSNGVAICSSFSSNGNGEEHLSSQTSVEPSHSSSEIESPKLQEDSRSQNSVPVSLIPVAAAAEDPSIVQKLDASVDHSLNSQDMSAKLPFPSVKSKASGRSSNSGSRQSSSPTIHEDLTSSESQLAEQTQKAGVLACDPSSLPSVLRRTSSMIRLSTTFDGRARVTTGSESPSPPKIRAPRPVTNLQRSQSAVEARRKPDEEAQYPSFRSPKRLMSGRSRDARTWEFYCDNDSRDALTEQAEREQSGSAAGAIGLIRSRSNKVLASNPNKRNVNTSRPESLKPAKGEESKTHKRKLDRTTSSVARLQTVNGGKQAVSNKPVSKKAKAGSQTKLLEDPGDSDKENWEPGTQTRIYRRRRPANAQNATQKSQSVLRESRHIPSQSSSHDPFLDTENAHHQDGQENTICGQEDEEVGSFMSGNDLPREADDLDAVQNLLSLSQGAWK